MLMFGRRLGARPCWSWAPPSSAVLRSSGTQGSMRLLFLLGPQCSMGRTPNQVVSHMRISQPQISNFFGHVYSCGFPRLSHKSDGLAGRVYQNPKPRSQIPNPVKMTNSPEKILIKIHRTRKLLKMESRIAVAVSVLPWVRPRGFT